MKAPLKTAISMNARRLNRGDKPASRPAWLTPAARGLPIHYSVADVSRAIQTRDPDAHTLDALLSHAGGEMIEAMARCAQSLTREHFGRTVSLYAPLYLSNHCTGGCAYCGYAADRRVTRTRLTASSTTGELDALKKMGFEDVLLLTGERCAEFGFEDLLAAVKAAATQFPHVAVEAFPMSSPEYATLAEAGCSGVTIYQETYDPVSYASLHRWGEKRDYRYRLDAPNRALEAGMRTVGLGFLGGLADPVADALSLYRHIEHLRQRHWRAGFTISFPRVRPQAGGYKPTHPVSDSFLAQMIFAFRICLPDVPLVLSTRECAGFRDGMAGVGINRMSVASRTTVGGYARKAGGDPGQFDVNDKRGVQAFCSMLRKKGIEPVFKNWDAAFR